MQRAKYCDNTSWEFLWEFQAVLKLIKGNKIFLQIWVIRLEAFLLPQCLRRVTVQIMSLVICGLYSLLQGYIFIVT